MPAAFTGNQLTVGEETIPREIFTSAAASSPASGQLRFTYFTARKTEVTTQVRLYTGSTAAAATPTLCRIGLWEVAANGDLTLVASTANDTTLFAAALTAYTRSWQSSYGKVAGRRYAISPLVVSAAAMPTFGGLAIAYTAEAQGQAPPLAGILAGQTDLPSPISAGSVAASGMRVYAAVLP